MTQTLLLMIDFSLEMSYIKKGTIKYFQDMIIHSKIKYNKFSCHGIISSKFHWPKLMLKLQLKIVANLN